MRNQLRLTASARAAALCMLAASAPTVSLAQSSLPYNLVSDGRFETGLSNFVKNQDSTSLKLNRANPIEGAQSLEIGIRAYGDNIFWDGHELNGMNKRSSNLFTFSAHIHNTIASTSTIDVCAYGTYSNGEAMKKCKGVSGAVGDKGVVSVALPLDPTRDLQYVYMGLFQRGSMPLQGVLLDSVTATLAGVYPAGTPPTNPVPVPPPPVTPPPSAPPAPPPSVPPVPTPDPTPVPVPPTGINLAQDSGFENGTGGFAANQSGTSAGIASVGAISGTRSLAVGIAGYGDSVLWSGRVWQELTQRRSSLYTVAARIKVAATAGSTLRLCAMVDYADGGRADQCTAVAPGSDGSFRAVVALDSQRDIDRVRVGLFQEGSAALSNVLVDDFYAVLDGVGISDKPLPPTGGGGNPAPEPETPAGTPYPGYIYSLPTVRPFISLAHYDNAAMRNPTAFNRFKTKIDDVVARAAAVPVQAKYAVYMAAIEPNHYAYSSVDAVLMFRLTGQQQYIRQAVRMTDLFIDSENEKIAAGASPAIDHDSKLDIGWHMEQIAQAYDYGHGLLSDEQKTKWVAYAKQAIYNLWNPTLATWGGLPKPGTGWSINNPGNNYYYSFIRASMMLALATQDQELISFLQQRKFTQIVPFFSQLDGGGTAEGTGYGVALGSMLGNYSFWKQSTGEDLSTLSPHARDTIDYWIHATVPTFDHYAPIADHSRDSVPRIHDYHRKLMSEAVALMPGTEAAARGTWWLNRIKVWNGWDNFISGRMQSGFNFRYDLLNRDTVEQAPAALMHDASGVGALFARSEWNPNASFVSITAGRFDESHAHYDQGSFSFWKNGWLSVSANMYSLSGLHGEVEAHNVVRFESNGSVLPQNHTKFTRSVSDNGHLLEVTADLSSAYSRYSNLLSNWTRKFSYVRSSHTLEVHDTCSAAPSVRAVWQLHVPVRPVVQPDGSILAGTLSVRPMMQEAPAITVVDLKATSGGEFTRGYRIELRAPTGCEYRVQLQAQ